MRTVPPVPGPTRLRVHAREGHGSGRPGRQRNGRDAVAGDPQGVPEHLPAADLSRLTAGSSARDFAPRPRQLGSRTDGMASGIASCENARLTRSPPPPRRPGRPDLVRTTITGQGAWRTTLSETLPPRARLIIPK